jgi:L-alanine-DL-glutamate epimerase-like enolase superfamily enzyme
MKITKIEAIPLIYPYDKPIYDAQFKASHRQALLVKVHTDEGITGIGEAASFGGPLDSTKTVVEKEIGPRIVGMDPLCIEKIWQMNYHMSMQHGRGGIFICALSGIDIALWDIMGQYLGIPLYKLLGGSRDKVKAYASGGFYQVGKGVKEIALEMKGYVEEGYTSVKMKVGRNNNALNPYEFLPDPHIRYTLEEELERVAAVKESIGSTTKLIVDANAAWDLHTALVMGKEFEKLGVYALEEPLCTDDLEGSSILVSSLSVKIAGYESEQGIYRYRELIRNNCIEIVQPDLTWAGGITECKKIAYFAYAFNKELAPHCFSSAITLVATLHFLAGIPNAGMLEMDRNPNGLREEIIKEPIKIDKDGFVRVLDKPGLGIELVDDAIEKYRIDK